VYNKVYGAVITTYITAIAVVYIESEKYHKIPNRKKNIIFKSD